MPAAIAIGARCGRSLRRGTDLASHLLSASSLSDGRQNLTFCVITSRRVHASMPSGAAREGAAARGGRAVAACRKAQRQQYHGTPESSPSYASPTALRRRRRGGEPGGRCRRAFGRRGLVATAPPQLESNASSHVGASSRGAGPNAASRPRRIRRAVVRLRRREERDRRLMRGKKRGGGGINCPGGAVVWYSRACRGTLDRLDVTTGASLEPLQWLARAPGSDDEGGAIERRAGAVARGAARWIAAPRAGAQAAVGASSERPRRSRTRKSRGSARVAMSSGSCHRRTGRGWRRTRGQSWCCVYLA